MVVFTCEACNESLKKNKVEQHLFRCRRARHVTCIDCQVDFGRESYKAHTSCISEMEKYSGPGYVAKASANKGAKKQDDWFQRVQSAIDSCSQQGNSPLSRVLYKVRESSNVPRKQAKFINFCRNSMKWANPTVIQEAWNMLADSAVSASKEEDEVVEAATADSKKRASNSEAEEEPVEKKQKKSELKVDQLESQPDKELSVKKKKTKKNKKDRKLNDEDESAAHAIAPSISEDAKAEATQEKKKKKKKKRKSEPCDEAAQPDADAEQCHENGKSLGATQKNKKKRSSEQNESKDAEPIADGAAECGEANAEPIVDRSPEKKSKKKKKRVSSQNGVDEAPLEPEKPAASEVLPEKKKKKKKRKRQSTEEDAETPRMTPCSVGLV